MSFLSPEEIAELRSRHRMDNNGKSRDRIKTVLLANDGWTYVQISEVLLIDEQTVSRHVCDYKVKKKLKNESGGSQSQLNETQASSLICHLKAKLYIHVQDICIYVNETYYVNYTVSGMTSWLKSKGFVYKKPKGRPFKADRQKQEAFIAFYEDLMNTSAENEPILFGDSVHPTQASKLTYGWIFKGEDHVLPTTGQKTRMNITGALNLETAHVFHQSYDKISGESFVDFLKKLQLAYPDSPRIHFIVDQGPCHTSKEVKAFLEDKNVRIKLHYLPSYSPNLNPIERTLENYA
jgi:transposase